MNIKFKLIQGIAVVVLAIFLILPNFVHAAVHVNGYFRSNGTYVAPYYRSNPDGNPYNNYSYPGNTNPYTGKTATGNPSTYLQDNGYSGYSAPSYTYNPPKTWNFDNQTYYSVSTYNLAKAAWLERHKTGIRNLYRTVLEREPYSEDEVSYWANKESDINKIRTAFLESDEYNALQQKKTTTIANSNVNPVVASTESNNSNDDNWFWIVVFLCTITYGIYYFAKKSHNKVKDELSALEKRGE